MTSWRSCSGRARLGRAAGLALALALPLGCRTARPPPRLPEGTAAQPVFALFAVQNAAGASAPVRAIGDALESALVARGLQVVPRTHLAEVMARHRIRYEGGLDAATAQVLRSELGVVGVLVPTLEQYAPGPTPKAALAVRFVEASDRPVVLWADAVARSGDDAPGVLGLGLVTGEEELQQRVVDAVARSVHGYLTQQARGRACGDSGHLGPHRVFRAPVLDDVARRTVAVLPFENRTRWDGADELVRGQFVAALARSGSFDVLDPGVVREELLRYRIVLERGVSIDRAMTLLDLLEADLLVAGDVQVYAAPAGPREPPRVEFSAFAIDRGTGELVWSSTASADGDDWLHFFGVGRERTSSGLSCRMVRGMVDGIVGDRLELRQADALLGPVPQGLRVRSVNPQFQRRARTSSNQEFYENGQRRRARGMNHSGNSSPRSAEPKEPNP